MVKGTKLTPTGYACLSCGEVVAKVVEDINKYCYECGQPLTLESIFERKQYEKDLQLDIVDKVDAFAKQGFSTSKIIDTIKFDIEKL